MGIKFVIRANQYRPMANLRRAGQAFHKFFPPDYIPHLCRQYMRADQPSTSLVIATYNWPQALELCLLSVLNQKRMPDEIVIADDGSKPDTRALIDQYRAKFSIPLQHIWHPDEGFKLAQIRNKANVAARGDYLIQVDGDLILHPGFIYDHCDAAKPGHFIGGSRVIMSRELSDKIFREKDVDVALFQKGIRNRFNGIHSSLLGRIASAFISTNNAFNIRGCNMSYWRKDFMAVNGYDEQYSGWGREDTDLVFRMYHSGLKRTFFKLRGVAYHLWHQEADRSGLSINDTTLEQTIQTKATRCVKGVDQYLLSI